MIERNSDMRLLAGKRSEISVELLSTGNSRLKKLATSLPPPMIILKINLVDHYLLLE